MLVLLLKLIVIDSNVKETYKSKSGLYFNVPTVSIYLSEHYSSTRYKLEINKLYILILLRENGVGS